MCQNKRSNHRHRSRVMKGNGHLSIMSTCRYYPEGNCLHQCLKQIPLIIQTSKMSQSHPVRATPHYRIFGSSGSELGWWALSLSKQGCRIQGLTWHALAMLLPFSLLPVALTVEAATNRVTNIFELGIKLSYFNLLIFPKYFSIQEIFFHLCPSLIIWRHEYEKK